MAFLTREEWKTSGSSIYNIEKHTGNYFKNYEISANLWPLAGDFSTSIAFQKSKENWIIVHMHINMHTHINWVFNKEQKRTKKRYK